MLKNLIELEKFYNELEEKNYKQFDPPRFTDKFDNLNRAYQKAITDSLGKRYFIDVYIYDEMIHPHTKVSYGFPVEFEIQLNDKETGCPLNLQFFAGWNLSEVEQRMKHIFDTALFDYYETWEDA